MKKLILFILPIFIFSSFVQSDTDTKNNTRAYNSNESLTYLLYYGFIKGGTAVLQTKPVGRGTIYAKATAKTMGITKAIVDIDDTFSSYFDAETGKPTKAIRDVKEGNYKVYNEVTFDHSNNKVYSQRKGTVDVPENIFDIISAFYYARNHSFNNLHKRDTIVLQTYFTDEVFPFMLVYNGKETIKTKSGKYNALKFTPIVETGRIFKENDDMRFWISDDKNHIPLRFEFDLILGSIKCDLIEHQNIKHSLALVK